MSGWRLLLADAVAAHPATIDASAHHWNDAAACLRLGLIERAGKGPRNGSTPGRALYRATETGLLLAAGRVAVSPLHGPRGRPRGTLAATWLRALPSGVTMDKRPPRAAVSEWGGLPS